MHSGLIGLAALLTSGGLLYAYYAYRVWRTARRASSEAGRADAVLVFGKRSPDGAPDADLEHRLRRTLAVLGQDASGQPSLYLLGGRTGGLESEATQMFRALQARGLPANVAAILEDQSQDTLQNLRHARELMRTNAHEHVLLISNRYHLARVSLLARNLGIMHQVIAAESDHSIATIGAGNVLREAVFLMWIDIGTRYARGMGFKRMLARVT
ncbi:YdcF family protein [Ahniella affigens]|nr:YdcF family protein [Ahniella affigens]